MTEKTCLEIIKKSSKLPDDPEFLSAFRAICKEARRIVAKINNEYHSEEELSELMSELIGKDANQVRLFPPIHADFGKNITIGKNVFINADCKFQDQGGIFIEDDVLIGHGVILATLNHGLSPSQRSNLFCKPIIIKKGAWIGSGSILLPGVTIGKYAVVAAGSIVTKDVEDYCIVAGNPAKFLKKIDA